MFKVLENTKDANNCFRNGGDERQLRIIKKWI
jgi:hypothetical protein